METKFVAGGALFTQDFLLEGIDTTRDWTDVQKELPALQADLKNLFEAFPIKETPNEAETESRLIYKITDLIGWKARSVQQEVERGRREIPDALLFLDAANQSKSDATSGPSKYRFADLVLEAKRWELPLDKAGGRESPPSAQLLNYLSRAEVQSDGRITWGILTNGRIWRLYWRGAKSLLTDYFEVDLGAAVGVCQPDDLFGALTESDRLRDLALFVCFFRRAAFDEKARTPTQTFHNLALEQRKFWEAKVTGRLRETIFDLVFPGLIRALRDADVEAPEPLTAEYLEELRDATFAFLYQILFTLYAEDRELLPKSDDRYDDYSLSKNVRDGVANQLDNADTLSATIGTYYTHARKTFKIINQGDTSVGVPPYNGGLFSPERAPLLDRAEIPDARFAHLLDALSRTERDGRKVRVSYRDLSVRELGSIYERLLEYEAIPEPAAPSGISIRLNPFARKNSGSYYTPDELVELIVERTLGPLVDEKLAAFEQKASKLAGQKMPASAKIEELLPLDPATTILELKICDPAMGSGHFLVSAVDYLAGRIFEATQLARDAVDSWENPEADYQSPLLKNAAQIRARIWNKAQDEKWAIRASHVSDETIVRRMVLKRCVYGVDKNPMAVELAKLSLWLHTLTAGAPLSFLDHHLRCGDSLFGETVHSVRESVGKKGELFLTGPLQQAEGSVQFLSKIEDLTDADMSEAKESAAYFESVRERIDPLQGFFSLIHCQRWLDMTKSELRALDALIDGQFGDPLRVAAGLDTPKPPSGFDADNLSPNDDAEQMPLIDGAAPASVRDFLAIRQVLKRARNLRGIERFLHWELAFPGVWSDWSKSKPAGGFDALVGNPPWDQMEFEEAPWFEARVAGLKQLGSAKKKAKIKELKATEEFSHFSEAKDRFASQLSAGRKMRKVFSGSKLYLHFLFVEQACRLVNSNGRWGLLVPTSVVSSSGSGKFVTESISTGRLVSVVDFENRGAEKGQFFPDIDARTRFAAIQFGAEQEAPDKVEVSFRSKLPIPTQLTNQVSISDVVSISPRINAIPEFASAIDVRINKRIYTCGEYELGMPSTIQYSQMINASTDRELMLDEAQWNALGAYSIGQQRLQLQDTELVPVSEGKTVAAYNHRAASVFINPNNARRRAQTTAASLEELENTNWVPTPQFWIRKRDLRDLNANSWHLAVKDVTSVTNERSCIVAIVPEVGCLHNLPVLNTNDPRELARTAGMLNSLIFDYLFRAKLTGTHVTKGLLNETPWLGSRHYDLEVGRKKAGGIIENQVLKLSYTCSDLEQFARDFGYEGDPFVWDEEERLQIRARLDALHLILFGVTDEAEVRHILSSFPTVKKRDRQKYEGTYLTEKLVLWHMRALLNGDSESHAPLQELLR